MKLLRTLCITLALASVIGLAVCALILPAGSAIDTSFRSISNCAADTSHARLRLFYR